MGSKNSAKSHKPKAKGGGKPRSSPGARKRAAGDPPASVALTKPGAAFPPSLPTDDEPQGVPTELPREKQPWYRPADSKARKLVDRIVVMRAARRPDADIAKKLGTTEQSIRQYIYLGKKNGWLDDEGEPVDIELEAALTIDRKVVRNVSASLDGQMTNWQTHEMTLAAAKGRGIFKSGEGANASGPTQLPVVAIQIVMPTLGAGDQMPEITEEQMGGMPAYVDAEVIDGDAGPATDSNSAPDRALAVVNK